MAAVAPYPRFRSKLALAVGLALLANWLIFPHELGLNLGLTALAYVAAAAVAQPAVRRSRLGLVALAVSAVFALTLIERPSPLGVLFFWLGLVVAVLAPRAGGGDTLRWAWRLAWAGLRGAIAPVVDGRKLLALHARGPQPRIRSLIAALVLPTVGGSVFLGLFVLANPVLSGALGRLSLPQLDVGRLVFTGAVLLAAWVILRPRGARGLPAVASARSGPPLPGVTTGSIALSLAVFNALFALQNGLDLAFLWSGAPLPQGVTLAEYAHRGAYPLIATALLAGLFVLVFLAPGSTPARSAPVRRLVVLWVAQNLFLVASTALRTVDYVQAYSLTALRIAALVWMALVALGLGLICWRMLRGKSASWLLNANALAAGLVLAASAVVDYDAVAASWNVRHAREIDGRGAALDLCLLSSMGPPALVSIAELARDTRDPDLRLRASYARDRIIAVRMDREGWRDWTWRNARRLQRADAIVAATPEVDLGQVERDCDGRPRATAPLTAAAQPRS